MITTADIFSAEQLNLICLYDTSSRDALRNDLVTALHDIYEPDMTELFVSTLEKLDAITDDEFAGVGFYIAEDYEDTSDYDEL